MSNLSIQKFLNQIKPFQKLDSKQIEHLSSLFSLREFAIGQPICHENLIPSEIFLIFEGEARLVIDENNQPITLKKLGPGDWVGLASFLRVKGCEEVSTSMATKVLVINDTSLLSLINQNEVFRSWCSKKLWTAELADLLKIIVSNRPNTNHSIKSLTYFLIYRFYKIKFFIKII